MTNKNASALGSLSAKVRKEKLGENYKKIMSEMGLKSALSRKSKLGEDGLRNYMKKIAKLPRKRRSDETK